MQPKSKLAVEFVNKSMLNDAINFHYSKSTNMFTENSKPYRQIATLEALKVDAQENGGLSLLDSLITHDANNFLNFSEFKN